MSEDMHDLRSSGFIGACRNEVTQTEQPYDGTWQVVGDL